MSYSALSPSARLVFCLIGSASLLGSVGSAVFSFVGWVVGSATIVFLGSSTQLLLHAVKEESVGGA